MDSDDYLMPYNTDTLSKIWKVNSKATAIINRSWYDNINSLKYEDPYEDRKNVCEEKIEGLDGMWYATKYKSDGKIVRFVHTPWLLSHKADVKAKWRDVVGEGTSEDVVFGKQVLDEGIALHISEPMYVRCHYTDRWDY
jgi:hypothetical protein